MLNFESAKCTAKLVHSAVGSINESDFTLAESTGSIILGFSTTLEPKVKKLLDKSSVRCENFKIIYEILDRIKELLEGLLDPILEERILGHAEIKEIFNSSLGNGLGLDAIKAADAVIKFKIRIIRDGIVVHTGLLGSLKRFKDDVKEVANGFECGIGFENDDDIKQGDIVEVFTYDKISQKIDF